jgi:hypothetical protein
MCSYFETTFQHTLFERINSFMRENTCVSNLMSNYSVNIFRYVPAISETSTCKYHIWLTNSPTHWLTHFIFEQCKWSTLFSHGQHLNTIWASRNGENCLRWRMNQQRLTDLAGLTFTSKLLYLLWHHWKDFVRLLEIQIYEGVSKSFRAGRLERELQMVQLSATRCSCMTFVSQSSEFCRHNPLCCFWTSVYYCCLFRYRLSPETFRYACMK